ncbi:MAG: endopeptidase La [Elusimicrobiota bacterium]
MDENKNKKDEKDRTQKIPIPTVLPLLPVRDLVVFPYMVVPLTVGRVKSIKALKSAYASEGKLIFLVTQKKMETEDPQLEDLFAVGTIVEILQSFEMPDGSYKILVEGIVRGQTEKFVYNQEKGFVEVEVKVPYVDTKHTSELEALVRQTTELFEQYVHLNKRVPAEVLQNVSNVVDTAKLADIIAAHLIVKTGEKQRLLETLDISKRLEILGMLMNSEIEILNLERKIQSRVKSQIEKTQKEYYLTEQMKAIQKELRQKDDFAKELDDLRVKIKNAKMPKEAEDASNRELDRLSKMMPFSPEATVVRTYLDWMIALPWSVETKDILDIDRAQGILDEDHFGLDRVKSRVVEYLAVCKLTKSLKGPILCFVGPPGVGKTSIAKSIARALGRKFVRISLGGVRDEAEIRGHRRTYIGSMPGRIIQSLRKAKSRNPVFLLDEIDKMGTDWRGDPAAALLEVLDPEQNHTFGDHYLDVEFNLSNVMFIATANTLYSIPPSLQDRLELIRFSGYTTEEKIEIAKRYLLPKQIQYHGLSIDKVTIGDKTLEKIAYEYTQEAGVRNLEREIANLCRKIAKEVVSREKDKKKKGAELIEITTENLNKYLGVPKYFREPVGANEVGVATGLAWTETGGELLAIEATLMPGREKLILTGKLGEVMRESAQTGLSFIRSQSKKLGLHGDIMKNKEVHIHVPEGAIPKDGPSAGIALATAFASLFTGKPVKKEMAMTGEITLRGRVLPIGGFKEKVLAAYREGMKTVIFPEGNRKDLEEIPEYVQKKIELIPVKHMEDVLKLALVPAKKKGKLSKTSKVATSQQNLFDQPAHASGKIKN